MNKKKTKALENFRSGYNCAQAVLSTFTKDLKVDSNLALGLSTGFGAGMGQLQETCGAATGSFMVLGLYNAQLCANSEHAKESTINMIQDFREKFKSIHGTMDCKSLLKCDLKTEEGQKHFQDNKLMESVCEKCVQHSVGIIQDLIK